MANYINKYSDRKEYNNDTSKNYPNVSLIEGEGIVFKPSYPVILTDSEIEWLFDDGTIQAYSDTYPSIDPEAAQTLFDALDNGYDVTATGWYKYSDDKTNIDIKDAEVEFTTDIDGFVIFITDGENEYKIGMVNVNESDGAGIDVDNADNPSAIWGITYQISEK